jgi:hypothetical protein
MIFSKALFPAVLLSTAQLFAADIRIGIVGCDTSHATAFTEALNDASSKNHVAGGMVVAAFKGGSQDIPESSGRIENISKTLREKYSVKFYDSIEELCTNVDAVCLESLDGRPKLDQIKPILNAKRPVFVDKPMGASVAEVKQIFKLAKEAGVPIFSSSSLRFAKDTQAVHNGSLGTVTNAETYGPCEIEPHHPDLFWYGVHGVEALYTIMGTGCQSVQRAKTADGKIEVIGTWPDGRRGIFREDKGFHGIARGTKGEAKAGSFDGYVPLVEQIIKFFETKVAPVSPEETIEIFAFMEAADVSRNTRGKPITLEQYLK